jgi:hypothetical protein
MCQPRRVINVPLQQGWTFNWRIAALEQRHGAELR